MLFHNSGIACLRKKVGGQLCKGGAGFRVLAHRSASSFAYAVENALICMSVCTSLSSPIPHHPDYAGWLLKTYEAP